MDIDERHLEKVLLELAQIKELLERQVVLFEKYDAESFVADETQREIQLKRNVSNRRR